jgi:hypothetical protein
MRGAFVDQGGLFSYIAPEARMPSNHPLRKIRELVRDVLGELNRMRVEDIAAMIDVLRLPMTKEMLLMSPEERSLFLLLG